MRRLTILTLAALAQACSGGAPASQTPATNTQPAPDANAHHDPHHHHDAHHHHHGPMVHGFTHAENWAKRFDAPGRDKWQKPEEVVALMAISPGMVVADIGAGTGYFLPHLSRAVGKNGKVWGLDISQDMVRYMKARVNKHGLDNVNPRLVKADDPLLGPASVDRILIVDTWHHIAERPAYARKLAAALRPGGKLVIVDFTAEAKHGPPKKFRLTPASVVAELSAAGLKPTIAKETLPAQYVIVADR